MMYPNDPFDRPDQNSIDIQCPMCIHKEVCKFISQVPRISDAIPPFRITSASILCEHYIPNEE